MEERLGRIMGGEDTGQFLSVDTAADSKMINCNDTSEEWVKKNMGIRLSR